MRDKLLRDLEKEKLYGWYDGLTLVGVIFAIIGLFLIFTYYAYERFEPTLIFVCYGFTTVSLLVAQAFLKAIIIKRRNERNGRS